LQRRWARMQSLTIAGGGKELWRYLGGGDTHIAKGGRQEEQQARRGVPYARDIRRWGSLRVIIMGAREVDGQCRGRGVTEALGGTTTTKDSELGAEVILLQSAFLKQLRKEPGHRARWRQAMRTPAGTVLGGIPSCGACCELLRDIAATTAPLCMEDKERVIASDQSTLEDGSKIGRYRRRLVHSPPQQPTAVHNQTQHT